MKKICLSKPQLQSALKNSASQLISNPRDTVFTQSLQMAPLNHRHFLDGRSVLEYAERSNLSIHELTWLDGHDC